MENDTTIEQPLRISYMTSERSELQQAVKTLNYERVQEIVDRCGEDLNDRNWITPLLMEPGVLSDVLMVELLISLGADVNAPDEFGITPLLMAAFKESPDRQIEGGTGLVYSLTGFSAALYTFRGNSENNAVVNLLLRHGAEARTWYRRESSAIYWAVRNQDMEMIEDLLAHGAGEDFQMENLSSTILHWAAHVGSLEVWDRIFREPGVTDLIASVDNFGYTPLYIAARLAHIGIVDRLIHVGAPVDMPSKPRGLTPLFLAAEAGHVDIMEKLLIAGASVEAVSQEGFTPLEAALAMGHFEAVKILFARRTERSKPVILNYAVTRGHDLILEWLLQQGADPNSKSQAGRTALMTSVIHDKAGALERLLRNGARVNERSPEGYTALHFAAIHGNLLMVMLLLEAGADMNSRSVFVGPPINWAVCNYKYPVVVYLLDVGANPMIHDSFGHTALDWAKYDRETWNAMQGWTSKHPADIHITPYQERQRAQRKTMIRVLLLLRTTTGNPLGVSHRGFRTLLRECLRGIRDESNMSFAAQMEVSYRHHDNKISHGLVCQKCCDTTGTSAVITGKAFQCTRCMGMDLCSNCMSTYRHENGFKGCVGHQFNEVMWPPVWNGKEVLGDELKREVYKEWLEFLAKRYMERKRVARQPRDVTAALHPAYRELETPASEISSLRSEEIEPSTQDQVNRLVLGDTAARPRKTRAPRREEENSDLGRRPSLLRRVIRLARAKKEVVTRDGFSDNGGHAPE